MPPFSSSQFFQLAHAFERSTNSCSSADTKVLEGFAAWELPDILGNAPLKTWSEWLVLSGYANTYPNYVNDRLIMSEVVRGIETDTMQYACMETLNMKTLKLEELAVYQVNIGPYLRALSNWIGLEESEHCPREVLDRTLWKLGDYLLDNGHCVAIYLARNIHQRFEQIRDNLRSIKQSIVVLTTSDLPLTFCAPENWILGALAEVAIQPEKNILFDVDWLHASALSRRTLATPRAHTLHYDMQTHILHFSGKPSWYVRGKRQQAAIAYMYKQWLANRFELRAKDIIEASSVTNYSNRNTRLPSLFQHTPWETYITRVRHGVYGFRSASADEPVVI